MHLILAPCKTIKLYNKLSYKLFSTDTFEKTISNYRDKIFDSNSILIRVIKTCMHINK